ncbi:PLP-dependent transferase [Mollisia scopiformis]|uniref:serine C-palmitoyltransferase n=1 Tax=Mollisia scopiformis TaxID=149040 RepID=A0A194X196_MOLSC|nr:PLP-dependent transferase [Mollisia scopiformis]KUJ13744.1 PLP-dependent transferase [Mollisia scopiformis]
MTISKPRDDGEAEYGHHGSQAHEFVCKPHPENVVFPVTRMDAPPFYIILTTYLGVLILIVFGRIRDFFGRRFKANEYLHLQVQNGYAPLYSDYDDFFTRRLKLRIDDCFARPCRGVPGRYLSVLERTSDDFNKHYRLTGKTVQALNMASYNYLGFARSNDRCSDAVEKVIRSHGLSYASSQTCVGTSDLLVQVETQIAAFVGKEAALLCSMGFQTNCSTLPCLAAEECLILSDELNHASLRMGARISGATIRSFRHNDMNDLERSLRRAISGGQPDSVKPWKKILVVVEGIYSMEGTMCNLPGIVALKEKYKCYLFVDEAHSIGAIGPRGRGVCDFFGICPSRVDVLMGTFSKSFGAVGGYIAGDIGLISKLRLSSPDTYFGEAPSPPILKQISSALNVMTGPEGEQRLRRLAFNSRYLRLGLKRLGFIIYGQDDSPVVPLLIYNTAKIAAFSREMLKRNIATVVVAFPATPMESARARLCLSAAHTKDDLDRVLRACDEVGDLLLLKLSSGIGGGASLTNLDTRTGFWKRFVVREDKRRPRWRLEDVLERGVSDVQLPLT